jgi:hypothetical protein
MCERKTQLEVRPVVHPVFTYQGYRWVTPHQDHVRVTLQITPVHPGSSVALNQMWEFLVSRCWFNQTEVDQIKETIQHIFYLSQNFGQVWRQVNQHLESSGHPELPIECQVWFLEAWRLYQNTVTHTRDVPLETSPPLS